MEQFREPQQILPTGRQRDYLMGRSLGGRTSLALPYYTTQTAFGEILETVRRDYDWGAQPFTNDLDQLAADRQLDNLLVTRIIMGGDQLGQYEDLRDGLVALTGVLERNIAER